MKPGTVIAERYEIVRPIGRGGQGCVVLAADRATGDRVALKLLDRGRVLSELRTARAISHPNVVRVHDVGAHDAGYFLTMEYVDGESLRERLDRRGLLPSGEALRLFRSILDGVRAAHDRGVVHRDLKPSNILIDADGEARVLDFGVAAFVGTAGSAPYGTLDYVSPAQRAGGAPSPHDDVHALGAMLFEMLTGRTPRAAGTSDARAIDPGLPAWIARLAERGLDGSIGIDAVIDKIDRRNATTTEPPTLPLARERGPRVVGTLVAASLTLLAVASWIGYEPQGLFADGEVRVVVRSPQTAGDDRDSLELATWLGEAVRLRLHERRDVRILALADNADPTSYRTEHLIEGRVARFDDGWSVVWSVLRLPDRESVLRERHAIGNARDWQAIDAAGEAFVATYVALLESEKTRR